MTLNSNINEIGNKSLHSRHDIKLQQSEESNFLQAKVTDQLFIDHLLLNDKIDLDQHSKGEYLVFLASTSGSFAKTPSFDGVFGNKATRKDMLSTSMIKLGNQFRYIKKKFGDEGIKIVTNHVIFDKWTKDNQIIELLGKILEKKGSRNRESP